MIKLKKKKTGKFLHINIFQVEREKSSLQVKRVILRYKIIKM